MTILLPAAPPSAPAASSRATAAADAADAVAFASHLESARGELAAQTPENENAAGDERDGRADGSTGDAAPLAIDREVSASLQVALPSILGIPAGDGLAPEGTGAAAAPTGDAVPALLRSTAPVAIPTAVALGDGGIATVPSPTDTAVSTPSTVPGSVMQPGLGLVSEASVMIAEAPAATLAQDTAAPASATPAVPLVVSAPTATGQSATAQTATTQASIGQATTTPAADISAAIEGAVPSAEQPATEQPPGQGTAQREGAAVTAPAAAGPVAETPRGTDATPVAAVRPASETRPENAAEAAPAAETSDPLAPLSPGPIRSTETAAPAAVAAPARTMGEQLVRPILTLRTAPGGEHVFTVQVAPEALGPVTVRAHVSADGVRIELIAANDQAREALKTLLPDLRRDLSQGGLSASLDLSAGQRESARSELGEHEFAQGGSTQSDGARQENPSRSRESAATETPHSRYPGSGASASIDVLA